MKTKLIDVEDVATRSPFLCYAYTGKGLDIDSCKRKARFIVMEHKPRDVGESGGYWFPQRGYCAHHAPEYVDRDRALRMDRIYNARKATRRNVRKYSHERGRWERASGGPCCMGVVARGRSGCTCVWMTEEEAAEKNRAIASCSKR